MVRPTMISATRTDEPTAADRLASSTLTIRAGMVAGFAAALSSALAVVWLGAVGVGLSVDSGVALTEPSAVPSEASRVAGTPATSLVGIVSIPLDSTLNAEEVVDF